MVKNKISLNIISSFNHSNFVGLLKNNKNYNWFVNEADYNQVFQTLSNRKEKIWKKKVDITLVWTTPETISAEFKKLLSGKKINSNTIKKEVIAFCSYLKSIKNYSDIILVPNWILKQPIENNLALSFSKESGLEYNLSLMNHCLSDELSENDSFYILNSSKWLANCGSSKTYNSKLWYLMKNPFSNEFYKEAISDFLNLHDSAKGSVKKLLILDLDDTLWGGIVGEVGWKNLRIGGHDYLGEAFYDFQSKIKALKERGILLAIASKNEESNAVTAIKKHPEMVLAMNDFVTYRINWNDKAKNINEIVKELNIGLQSVVFFDDSPFERERVREILPEVFVPDLPKDPTEYSNFLSRLCCFDTTNITTEDVVRADLYKSEFKRTKLKKKYETLSSWIETLDLEVSIENIKSENVPRSFQLLNKVNQMNLSTRRLSKKEFKNWINKKSNYLWTVRAKDKFGDYGIIGILSISLKNKNAHIVDFIMSCRVVGRFIEETIIKFLKDFCLKNNIKKISGTFIKTKKNALCYQFLKKLKIIDKNKNNFVLSPNKNKINLPNITVIKPKFKDKINVPKNIMAK